MRNSNLDHSFLFFTMVLERMWTLWQIFDCVLCLESPVCFLPLNVSQTLTGKPNKVFVLLTILFWDFLTHRKVL